MLSLDRALIQPRRPFRRISFVPNTVLPSNIMVVGDTFGVSTINLLENSARSWYNAGYVNVRRRYVNGLSFLANYTWSKSLSMLRIFARRCLNRRFRKTTPIWTRKRVRPAMYAIALRLSAVYDLPGLVA